MSKPDVQFIGGPYLSYPNLSIPAWFPPSYCGVIGITPAGDSPKIFADDGGPMLLGGNTVIRRSTLLSVGRYSTHLAEPIRSCSPVKTKISFFACSTRVLTVTTFPIWRFFTSCQSSGSLNPIFVSGASGTVCPELASRVSGRVWCQHFSAPLATCSAYACESFRS